MSLHPRPCVPNPLFLSSVSACHPSCLFCSPSSCSHCVCTPSLRLCLRNATCLPAGHLLGLTHSPRDPALVGGVSDSDMRERRAGHGQNHRGQCLGPDRLRSIPALLGHGRAGMGEGYWAGAARDAAAGSHSPLPVETALGEVLPVPLLHLLSLSPHSVRLSPTALGRILCQGWFVGARDHPCCQEGGTLLCSG